VTVPSMTVLKELMSADRLPTARGVVFATPRAVRGHRIRCGPAPQRACPACRGSRRGATIAKLYGDTATVYLGPQATEKNARCLSADTDIVHFATHSVLSSRFPSTPASCSRRRLPRGRQRAPAGLGGHGVVRLDSRLVTLSGCSTAVGGETPGEAWSG